MGKEKYEPPNARRAFTIMNQDDVAAGKESSWYELELTGMLNIVVIQKLFLIKKQFHQFYGFGFISYKVVPAVFCYENVQSLTNNNAKVYSLFSEINSLFFNHSTYQLMIIMLNIVPYYLTIR